MRLGCWDAFPPTPPGLGFPFLSLQSPLFLSPHLPLWSSAPFFYGGGLDWRSKGKAGRLLSHCFQIGCVCVCVAVQCTPHGERTRSVTRSTFCSHTTGRASLINLQCSPISEYFVFVQSGEFPASCMCQGVCAPGSLFLCPACWPAACLGLPAFSLDASSSARSLPPTSILLLSRFIQRNAMPVNQYYIIKQKCLHKVFCGHRGVVGEKNVFTFLSSTY